MAGRVRMLVRRSERTREKRKLMKESVREW